MKTIVLIFLIHSFSLFANTTVYSTIGPISYLIEKIAGDRLTVKTLIPSGKSPHDFSPTPKQIKDLAQASIYFTIDAPFEMAISSKLQNLKNIRVISIAKDIKKRILHEHHHDGNTQGEIDNHIWLSPSIIKKISVQITKSLSELIPLENKFFISNLNKLIEEIDTIHNSILKELAPLKGKTVFVFHPAFGYFLEEYGLHQKSIEFEGKEPTPKHIANIILESKKENISVIFTQPQFSQKAALTIAKGINGTVVSINPLEKNILDNLKDMAQNIRKAYLK